MRLIDCIGEFYDEPKPEWSVEAKLIEGFENYAVTIDGRVFNIKRKKWRTPTPATDTGELVLLLVGAQKQKKRYTVKNLVANAFLPGKGRFILHMNGDILDNRALNLKYVNRQEIVDNTIELQKPEYMRCVQNNKYYYNSTEAARDLQLPEEEIRKCWDGAQDDVQGFEFLYLTESEWRDYNGFKTDTVQTN